MSLATQLKKYFWMLSQFQSGPIDKETIDRRWERCRLNEKHEKRMPDSTFYTMRRQVEELFDVDIDCDAKGRYFIPEGQSGIEAHQQWLLSGMTIGNTLQQSKDLQNRILFEDIPHGTNYLPTIVDAMQNNYRLIMRYHSFNHDPHEFIFAPYAIKVFKQRWYVFGESSEYPKEVRVFAFDRILTLQTTNDIFKLPKNFDAERLFASRYGVTLNNGMDIETIKIRVWKSGVPYLRTLPLHSTQEEIETCEDYSIFQFKIVPTIEFVIELMSRGPEITVLSPETFRQNMIEMSEAIYDNYHEETSEIC